MRHQAELLVDVGGVAPRGHVYMMSALLVRGVGVKNIARFCRQTMKGRGKNEKNCANVMCICPPGGEVPIRVVELGVPREEHAGEELLHLELDEERDGDEVVVDHHPGQEVAEPGRKGPRVVDAQVPVVGEVGPALVALGGNSMHSIDR